MLLLSRHLAFLPACLTLGSLLCSLPTLADTPAAPAAAPTAQTILLQHTVPGDILKALHWDQSAQRFDSTAPVRVEGVTQISAQPATNSLSVVATPSGLARVQQLVKILDIAQRQVQIKFALAHVTDAGLKVSGLAFDSGPVPNLLILPIPDTKYAAGSGVATFLQTLAKQGAVTQAPTVTTMNNVDASLTLTTVDASLSLPTSSRLQVVSSATFAATPRVNSDDSVTLALHPVFQDGAAKREIKTLRTVKSGDTLVMVMPPDTAGGKHFLMFVTPTILPTGGGAAAITVK